MPTMYRYCVLLPLVVSGINAQKAEPLLLCGDALYRASQVYSYLAICWGSPLTNAVLVL